MTLSDDDRVGPFVETSEWADHLRDHHGVDLELDWPAAVAVHQFLHYAAATGRSAPIDHWHGNVPHCAANHVNGRKA